MPINSMVKRAKLAAKPITWAQLMSFGLKTLSLFLCSLLLCPPQLVFAAGPVASGATTTTVTAAANGVPVVNIAAPNASGMSHNKYTSYNVDLQGLVLNNGNTSQAFRQSQLAGQVAANQNLGAGAQAQFILNEVTSPNRSVLAGFTEVLGGKAAVIVANPFGITCNGCGFINTDRVSLITGTPNFTAGAISSFGVNGGDILISGTGINASAQQTLDLVSRKIVLNGQVNAPTLNLTAGTNTWDYNTGIAAPTAPGGGPAPTYAIDSSALGGMYAGRINLQATEAGVGVHMLGNAAATADDFIINSAGKIELANKLSAVRDLTITSTSAGADAIKATDASLTAGHDLILTASSGGATLNGGVLVATGNLNYNLGTLTDVGTGTVLTDNNKRYGATATLNGSGAWTMDGVNYGSSGAFSATTGSMSIGSSAAATLYSGGTLGLTATSGGLTLTNAALQSVGDMTLGATSASSTGILTFDSAAQAKSTAGNMNLNAWHQMFNSGALTTSTGNIVIRSGSGVSSDTRFTNQGAGSIWAGGQLNMADRDGLRTQNIELKGTSKLGGSTVGITASRLALMDTAVLTSLGDMTLNLNPSNAGSLTVGAKILAATSGTGTLHLNTSGGTGWHGVRNAGLIHSGQDIDSQDLGVGGEDYSTGTVSAVRNLSLAGFDYMNGNYIAGNDLTLASIGQINLYPNSNGSPNAVLSAGNDISITGSRVRNWSTMNAGRDITINASDLFTNAIGDSSALRLRYYDIDLGTIVSITAYRPQVIAGRKISIYTGNVFFGQNVGTISAPTVDMSGFGFYNAGTIRGSAVNIVVSNFSNVAGGASAPGAASATSLTPTPVHGGVSFGAVAITIPTSPNGVFIPVASPGSHFLVESNPLYTNVDNFLGSDYLAEKYNFKADEVIKRLGDAGYETFLVQQQLIGLAGTNLLAGYASEKAQMKGLMDHAGSQAKTLGLAYGRALSSTQQANLKEDMVWMVETTVNGQKVLAPVVYLAASTRQMFDGAPTVTAETINMNVASLANAGTIKGNTINVTATGDVRNTGGTIKGGDISIASTGGSVINEAAVNEKVINRGGYIDVQTTVGKGGTIQGTGKVNLTASQNVENVGGSIQGGQVNLKAGGDVINSAIVATNVSGTSLRQTIAATGSITSTGNLNVDAGRDVQNLGAQLSAGKDASITAGRDVTFDTVALANRDTSSSSSRSFFKNSDSSTTTTTTTQVQGGLTTGGNLAIKAKNDVTLASANLSAGKDASIDAGGDLNILARSNSVQAVTQSSASGVGVGTGLLGKEKSTTDAFSSRAVASNLGAGAAGSIATAGNLSLSAGKTVTLEGAKVNTTGGISIAADDVQVLAAKDIDRTTTVKETTSYLAISKGENAKTNTTAKSSVKSDGVVKAGVTASATNDAGGLDFSKTVASNTFDETVHSVGSTLASGGGLTITSKKNITLQGADVKAKGDVDLTAQNVNIMAAQDTHTYTDTTTTTKVGLYASTTNTADATAGAGATATAVVGTAGANAGATATANAASSTNLDVMRTKTIDTNTVDVTNTGTSLASGGVLRINSAKTLTVQGSDVSGEQGVDVKAKDILFTAAQDTHSSTVSTSSTSAGLYIDGNANAAASATAGANAGIGANAGTKAEASAKAKLSIGVQAKNTATTETDDSSTARVSTITSGSGGIKRTAENSITDVGTAIDAAGDFSQSATTIASRAAVNTASQTRTSTSNVGKIGVYAKAEAGVSAEAGASAGLGGAKAGAGAEAKASVGAGIQASYSRDTNDSTSASSDAVVSTIKSGGKVTSVSTDKTSFEGTQISAGKGVEIEAGSLDFAAAKSTTSNTSSVGNTNAAASVGLSRGTGKGVDVDVSAGTSKTDKSASSSTASAGSIASGGDIVIKTKGDTRLEGTNLGAAGDTSVAAGGNLILDAARDSTRSDKSAYDATASVSTSKSSGGGGSSSGVNAGVSGGFSKSTSESSTATAGSISSGGKVTLSAGKTATLEGTTIAAGGDASISGADGVTMSAARSTSSSESYGARAGVDAGKGKGSDAEGTSSSTSGGVTAEGNYSRAKESKAEAGSISSGGNLKITSNKDVTLEGTTLGADGKASVLAGGNVNFKAAESTSESVGFSASVTAKADKTDKTPAKPAAPTKPTKPAMPTTPPPALPGAAKPSNPGTGGTQGADGSKQSPADLAKWQGQQGAVNQQLKDRQAASASSGPGTTGTRPAMPTTPPPALPAKATAPPLPSRPAPALPGAATPKLDLTNTGNAASAAGKGALGIKPPLPKTPPPALPGAAAAPAAEDTGSTTEKNTAVSAGAQLQLKNKTTQKAGSISAGAGGIEIVAGGGDVNLVGTNINTSGDANISAARDVNISATKNTESGFSASGAVSVDRKTEGPTTPPPAQPNAKRPPMPTTPPPALPGATTPKLDLTNTGNAASAAGKGALGIKPPLPKSPPPALPAKPTAPPLPSRPAPALPGAATPKLDLTNTGNAAGAAGKGALGIKPPLPKSPPPALPGAAATPATPAADEKDPNVYGGSASASSSTTKDPSKQTSAFVGVGGGGSIKNTGAVIKTGGKLNIKSGGKTTLTNTDIKAQAGEVIDAAGGVERKTEKDVSVLNANTDSGAAGTNMNISKVPVSSGAAGSGVAATPSTPVDTAGGTGSAPQSTLKTAQGGTGSTPGPKKP